MWFEKQEKLVRILLLVPCWGWLVSALYRVVKYTETKNTTTLVFGILCFVPFIGAIISLVDLITTAVNDKITVLVE